MHTGFAHKSSNILIILNLDLIIQKLSKFLKTLLWNKSLLMVFNISISDIE